MPEIISVGMMFIQLAGNPAQVGLPRFQVGYVLTLFLVFSPLCQTISLALSRRLLTPHLGPVSVLSCAHPLTDVKVMDMYATRGLGLGPGVASPKALTWVQSVVEEWIDFAIIFEQMQ